MSRTLAALRRIEARGLALTSSAATPELQPEDLQSQRWPLVGLERAESLVEAAIDDFAWGANRPIPALDWSELMPGASTLQPSGIELDSEQPDFTPEPERQFGAATSVTIRRCSENFEVYRALRSRLVARQSKHGGSVLLLAAATAEAARRFSAASLAIALAELDLGEVLLVDRQLVSRPQGMHHVHVDAGQWQDALRKTSEPQIQVLPADADCLSTAAASEVCLWDCLRRRFRFTLLGPWLSSDAALARIAASHDGALLLVDMHDSQRSARRAARVLTASGARLLGCVVTT